MNHNNLNGTREEVERCIYPEDCCCLQAESFLTSSVSVFPLRIQRVEKVGLVLDTVKFRVKKKKDHHQDSVDADSDARKMKCISQPKTFIKSSSASSWARSWRGRRGFYHDYSNTQSFSISVHNRVPHEITRDLEMNWEEHNNIQSRKTLGNQKEVSLYQKLWVI